MAKIFISYRRQDSAYVASVLTSKLQEQFGAEAVFMDIDDIPFGVDFREHISEAVGKCDILLALIGDTWLNTKAADGGRRLDQATDFVRLEIEAALNRKIPVIPVLLGNARMPGEKDLPGKLSALAYRNAAEVRSGRDMWAHIDRLLKGIDSLFKSATAAKPTAKKVVKKAGPKPAKKQAASNVYGPLKPSPDLKKAMEKKSPKSVKKQPVHKAKPSPKIRRSKDGIIRLGRLIVLGDETAKELATFLSEQSFEVSAELGGYAIPIVVAVSAAEGPMPVHRELFTRLAVRPLRADICIVLTDTTLVDDEELLELVEMETQSLMVECGLPGDAMFVGYYPMAADALLEYLEKKA